MEKNLTRENVERICRKIAERVVTAEMRTIMSEQHKHMQAHAETLQDRLIIGDLYKNKHKE